MIRAISIGVAVIFLLQIFYYTSKHRLRDRYAFLWMMIGLWALPRLLRSLCFTNWFPRSAWPICPQFVFLIVIIVALSLLVHTTTVLSKHQEIIKILVQENAYMNKEIKDLKAKVEQQERQHFHKPQDLAYRFVQYIEIHRF
ncbi:DUF2304 domain-containing protein [Paenibacillus larvae]|nr:DUF2304 domain-containing protein [Paenibacillus larvae]MDT2284860.1 DUF2304 domain-containing protein [Paenibacillus larvae]